VPPVITFDQPLWWKVHIILASEPPESELHSLVVRLGGFHAEMSFLGCIGHVMSGSGLQELLEVVYSPNTVTHILSGKAVARAVRGHLLMDSALSAMVAAKTFNTSLPADPESDERQAEDDPPSGSSSAVSEVIEVSSQSGSDEMDVDSSEDSVSATVDENLATAVQLCNKLVSGELSVQDVCSARCLDKIQEKLEAQNTQMAAKRTSKLWLQYMEMVDILHLFIKAERTGDWMLHLKSIQQMLPFFAASAICQVSIHLCTTDAPAC